MPKGLPGRPKGFLSARIKTGSNHERGPACGEHSRSTKVEPRCRERNRRWRTATSKNYLLAPWDPARENMRFVKTDFAARKGSEIN